MKKEPLKHWLDRSAQLFLFPRVFQIKSRMETCIRGDEELSQAFQMDRKLEVNKQKRLEGQGAAGGEFFSLSSPSPSTTSQVCLSCHPLPTLRFAAEVTWFLQLNITNVLQHWLAVHQFMH